MFHLLAVEANQSIHYSCSKSFSSYPFGVLNKNVTYPRDNIALSNISLGYDRSQDGVVKVWDLERRRVCAEFEATSHGMGVQRLDRLGRNKVVR